MQKITVSSNEAGQRLDKLLGKYLSNAPMSFVYKMLRKKNIKLNGKKAQGNETTIFPVKSKKYGVDIMSINVLLENESDPVVWRGPVIGGKAASGRSCTGNGK